MRSGRKSAHRRRSDLGYGIHLDDDADGIGCEQRLAAG